MFKSVIFKIFVILLIIALLFTFSEDIENLNIQETILETTTVQGAILAIFVFFILKSIFFFIPILLIFISSGMVLPLPFAVLVSTIGFGLELSLTYIYGYYLGNDFAQNILSRYKKIEDKINNAKNEITTAFFLRLLPVGIEPASFLMGAGGYKFVHYLGASIMGGWPRILLYVVIGNSLAASISLFSMVQMLVLLAGWIVLMIYFKRQFA